MNKNIKGKKCYYCRKKADIEAKTYTNDKKDKIYNEFFCYNCLEKKKVTIELLKKGEL